MPPASPADCRRCGLWLHVQTNEVPEDRGTAWQVFQRLNSPAVQRLGLQRVVLDTFDLTLTERAAADLFDALDAIESGLNEARTEIEERDKGKE